MSSLFLFLFLSVQDHLPSEPPPSCPNPWDKLLCCQSKLRALYSKKYLLSLFWKPEFWNQGVSMAMFHLRQWVKLSLPLPSAGGDHHPQHPLACVCITLTPISVVTWWHSCMALSKFPPSCKDISHIELDFSLTWLHLWRPSVQIWIHFKVLEVKTLKYLSYGDTIQYITLCVTSLWLYYEFKSQKKHT